MSENLVNKIAFIFIVLGLTGCAPSGPKSSAEISGEYAYQYKSGQIEVVILSSNFSYVHYLYPNKESYQQHVGASFTNNGTWSYTGNILKSDDWANFFNYEDLDTPKIPHPLIWQASWDPPTKESDASIIEARDLGYIFERVKK